jgi:hypothetical protein
MAILTALLSFVGKQVSSILRAVLGWSVSALFGRISDKRATVLSALVVASLLWPVLVLGVFFPAASAWAFALLPLEKWFGPSVVRAASVLLALVLPMVIGLVARSVAPSGAKKGGLLRAMFGGYPLALGFAISCVITAVLVPLVKIGSLARGWSDAHVYVQPKKGRYDAALGEVMRACEAAGVSVRAEPVPRSMGAATRVLKLFAHGSLDALVEENPERLRGRELEVYLYPADLLLRGKEAIVSRVRARMMETKLEREAFLVADPHAQIIQTALGRIGEDLENRGYADALRRHERARLERVRALLEERALPFDEWLLLDRSLRCLEQNPGDRTGVLSFAEEEPSGARDVRAFAGH